MLFIGEKPMAGMPAQRRNRLSVAAGNISGSSRRPLQGCEAPCAAMQHEHARARIRKPGGRTSGRTPGPLIRAGNPGRGNSSVREIRGWRWPVNHEIHKGKFDQID